MPTWRLCANILSVTDWGSEDWCHMITCHWSSMRGREGYDDMLPVRWPRLNWESSVTVASEACSLWITLAWLFDYSPARSHYHLSSSSKVSIFSIFYNCTALLIIVDQPLRCCCGQVTRWGGEHGLQTCSGPLAIVCSSAVCCHLLQGSRCPAGGGADNAWYKVLWHYLTSGIWFIPPSLLPPTNIVFIVQLNWSPDAGMSD